MSSYGKKSHGTSATMKLKKNVETQLKRLLQELEDLEEMKEDMEEDEYREQREETVEELKLFQANLQELIEGNVDLISDLSRIQLAIRATIKDAFDPEIVKMFAACDPKKLRAKLTSLKRDLRLKKIDRDAFDEKAAEILAALRKMGETLGDEERGLLAADKKLRARFTKAEASLSEATEESVMKIASKGIKASSSSS